MAQPTQVPRRRWSLRMRNFRGSLLVSGFDGENSLELNDAARFMFRAMDGVRTVAEIGELTAREYGIPDQVAADDVSEFIEDLARAGLVELLPPAGPGT